MYLLPAHTRFRLLDLFSGTGGTGWGYYLAGFDVTGVDIAPQLHYPAALRFVQADALEYVRKHGHEYDAIHASPPCQGYSEMTPHKYRDNHPDLIAPIRELLRMTGKPYVIENVPNARQLLRGPLMLCGSMFGLPIQRHRYFEFWPTFIVAQDAQRDRLYCRHIKNPVLITDHGGPNANGPGKPRKRTPADLKRKAMRAMWMSEMEISEAIPPAYTRWIGAQLLRYLHNARPADQHGDESVSAPVEREAAQQVGV